MSVATAIAYGGSQVSTSKTPTAATPAHDCSHVRMTVLILACARHDDVSRRYQVLLPDKLVPEMGRRWHFRAALAWPSIAPTCHWYHRRLLRMHIYAAGRSCTLAALGRGCVLGLGAEVAISTVRAGAVRDSDPPVLR